MLSSLHCKSFDCRSPFYQIVPRTSFWGPFVSLVTDGKKSGGILFQTPVLSVLSVREEGEGKWSADGSKPRGPGRVYVFTWALETSRYLPVTTLIEETVGFFYCHFLMRTVHVGRFVEHVNPLTVHHHCFSFSAHFGAWAGWDNGNSRELQRPADPSRLLVQESAACWEEKHNQTWARQGPDIGLVWWNKGCCRFL